MTGLGLRVIGGFALTDRGAPVTLPHAAQRLIAYVALHEAPLARLHIAGTLWPSTTDEHAMANLRSTLWRTKRSIDPILEVGGDTLTFGRGVTVDLRLRRALARRIISGVDPEAEPLGPESLLRDDLLPDWYDDWVMTEREGYRQLRLHALESLANRLISTGAYARAIEAALAALACDPLRETPHSLLIRAHLAEGNRSEAVRQFRAYARLMSEELGLPPAIWMRNLIDVATDDVPALRHDVGSVRAGSSIGD